VDLFQFDEFSKKTVVVGIGNLWAVFDVVEIVMAPDFVPEGSQSGKNVGVGHRAGRDE
jgi:hypothetical protein